MVSTACEQSLHRLFWVFAAQRMVRELPRERERKFYEVNA